ncbi:MAG: N-acetyltransferase [bacterium]|nr:N-acetyltransferase [bacterium]
MVYKNCPECEDKRYYIRRSSVEDAADLVRVYSDKKALPFMNSDNCNGDNFYTPTEEAMKQRLEGWNWVYEHQEFVRFSIVDKTKDMVIGTIELFHRDGKDYFTDCGLLRLDLRSDYEETEVIYDILALISSKAYEWFDCTMIATKAPIYEINRIEALKRLGYKKTKEKFYGQDGTAYCDYWCLIKKKEDIDVQNLSGRR